MSDGQNAQAQPDTKMPWLAVEVAERFADRLATVDEVAAAVCYLASPQGASITGQTLVLDGGITVA